MFSLLRDANFAPTGCYRAAFVASLTAFFVASSAGAAAVVTRLLDFRLTAKKVRKGETEEPLTIFGTDASGYGRATWRLFWTLVVSFSAAVLLASLVIVRVHLKRLIG